MNLNGSAGPNTIHPWVLEEPAEELSEELSIIFGESWVTSEVWWQAEVVLIFKKGSERGKLQTNRPDFNT